MIDRLTNFLEQNKISYTRYDHVAVFTCEEALEHTSHIPGGSTKNLFLRDKAGKRHFLVSVDHEKQVDLKALGNVLGVNLSFASPERLKKYLGVEPGSVTLFGLMNDAEHGVEVYIDKALWPHEVLQCHPLVNTATLTIAPADLEKFFKLTGHTFNLIDVPSKMAASA